MKNKGFTLIELLVVIVLMGLMAAWYTNSYFLQREKENLLSATATVRSFLDNIRQGSVSVLVPEEVDPANFKGYGFSSSADNNLITRVYVSNIGTTNLDNLDLGKFSHIEIVSPNSLVYFAKGSGYLLTTSDQTTSITIMLKNSIINKCVTLEVNNQGIITTNDDANCPP